MFHIHIKKSLFCGSLLVFLSLTKTFHVRERESLPVPTRQPICRKSYALYFRTRHIKFRLIRISCMPFYHIFAWHQYFTIYLYIYIFSDKALSWSRGWGTGKPQTIPYISLSWQILYRLLDL